MKNVNSNKEKIDHFLNLLEKVNGCSFFTGLSKGCFALLKTSTTSVRSFTRKEKPIPVNILISIPAIGFLISIYCYFLPCVIA